MAGQLGRIRTVVTFESNAFNTTEPREYFLNPSCFGDDVLRDVVERLKRRGIPVETEPGQEDFGWYLTFDADGVSHNFVLGFRDEDDAGSGTWIGWVERNVGLLGTLFGRRKAVSARAVAVVRDVLSSHQAITSVRWHKRQDFDRGNEEQGTPNPNAPTKEWD